MAKRFNSEELWEFIRGRIELTDDTAQPPLSRSEVLNLERAIRSGNLSLIAIRWNAIEWKLYNLTKPEPIEEREDYEKVIRMANNTLKQLKRYGKDKNTQDD